MAAVNGVVLYWGHEGSDRAQMRYYLFLSHLKALKDNTKRLLIYDGPPEDKPDFLGAGTWPLAWARDGREPEELREFLKEIANG